MRSLGVALPPDVPVWDEFVTIKIEIGVAQDWGATDGQLDWKAHQWAAIPGMAYVLCIHVSDGLQAAEYKLYEVSPTGLRPPYQANASTAIVAPTTTVSMDMRRVLGLRVSDALPTGVPELLAIDLFAVLEMARDMF